MKFNDTQIKSKREDFLFSKVSKFIRSPYAIIVLLSVLLIIQVVQNQMVLQNANPRRSDADFLKVGNKVNIPSLQIAEGTGANDFSLRKDSSKLIIYLQTSCQYCHQDIPLWKKIYAQASDRNIDVFAVTQENDSALLRKYALDNDLPFPIIMDPDRKLISQLKVPATPTKVLISSDQRVLKVWQGLTTQQSGESDIGSLASTFDIWSESLPKMSGAPIP